ncbi:MAG TPA: GNAT family N-acetyltransferase [Ruminiclostridium sp.]|nr:GNAT family N-acetyltransferase [Ruminiclostridium sp.]
MLTHLTEENISAAERILNARPELNVRVSALLKAYGVNHNFFNLWLQGETTLLARLEESFFLYSYSNTDYDEIAFFLKFNPYFKRLIGKADVVEAVAGLIDLPIHRKKYDFLEFSGQNAEMKACKLDYESDLKPNLKHVYEIMKRAQFSIGDFVPWYADISYRIRHGCARAFLIRVDEIPVTACLVSAESSYAGLLSGIATLPEYRSRGLASEIVMSACKALSADKKRVVLECEHTLTGFYRSLGFKKTNEVEELTV